MAELKPFGGVPEKLTIQVKRSFVATRTFVRALYKARDVIANILRVRFPRSLLRVVDWVMFSMRFDFVIDVIVG